MSSHCKTLAHWPPWPEAPPGFGDGSAPAERGSAAATSAGSGAWDFPDSRRWRTLLRPRMRALRLVRAATACERFRLTGKMPAATLNTYRGEGESSAVFRPYRGRPLEKTFYCTAAGI